MLSHLEMEIITKLLKVRLITCKYCKKESKIFTEKGIDASLSFHRSSMVCFSKCL